MLRRALASNVLPARTDMSPRDPVFVVPTYRLRDVGETIERYDENFRRNGHAVKMMVFDDSTLSTHEKYYPLLEQTRTANEVYYVGPREKAAFVRFLLDRLRDRRLEPLVKSLFRPSYGGNRNFTLMYTLGCLLVSSDDDMRPEALVGVVRCPGPLLGPADWTEETVASPALFTQNRSVWLVAPKCRELASGPLGESRPAGRSALDRPTIRRPGRRTRSCVRCCRPRTRRSG